MRLRILPALALACAPLATIAQADEATVPVQCVSVSDLKNPANIRRATHDEWIGLRTAFFMARDTPANVPPGDQALIQENEDGTETVVFLDGGDACAPMTLGVDGVAMLKILRAGTITHPTGKM